MGELGQIQKQLWQGWVGVAFLSGTSNVLALSGSVFMLSVYDRVIPSGSVPTLVALGLLCLAAYALQAFVDIVRGMMLARIGLATKEALASRTFDISVRSSATPGAPRTEPSKDLDRVQGFLSSAAPGAFFDLPWVPLYLSVCFLFHFWIGLFVTASALLLILLAIAGELLTRKPSNRLSEVNTSRASLLSAGQNNAEALHALGMTGNIADRWVQSTQEAIRVGQRLSDTVSVAGSLSRTTRMVVQSAVLALGAVLVMAGEASGGVMIASSILSARALSPIDSAIAASRSFLNARQSWTRLSSTLASYPPEDVTFTPPRPALSLSCENVTVTLDRSASPALQDISFGLAAGECLAVLGATGSGKTTLSRSLVGLLAPISGSVRLDGASLYQWPTSERGRFVGYLPQQIALFEGTIAENISRFEAGASADRIIAASQLAGIHELISRFPEGYSTRLGPGGAGLSGGQAQRVGIARAIYGKPFLVVLDEPNSGSDADGDAGLLKVIQALKDNGSIVIVITHRPGVLRVASKALVLSAGRMQSFGTAAEVVNRLAQSHTRQDSHAA